jgi:hypothetical protein
MVLPISGFLPPPLHFAPFPGCSAVPVPMVLLATFLPLADSAVWVLALQVASPWPDEFPLLAFFPPAGNLLPLLLPSFDLLSVDLGPVRPVTLQWDPNLEADLAGYRVYSTGAKKSSENSLSPLYLKGHNDYFDGHRTSPPVPFGPPALTLPLGGGRCEKIGIFPLTLPSPARGISANLTIEGKEGVFEKFSLH